MSPGRTGVLSRVPVASSRTEWARRQPDSRQGGTLPLTFLTTFRRSMKTRSMANRIPMVCIASQGTIHRPSPSPRDCLPSKPRVRAGPRSATSTQDATMLCVLRLRTVRRVTESPRRVDSTRFKPTFWSQREISIEKTVHSACSGDNKAGKACRRYCDAGGLGAAPAEDPCVV